MAIIKCKMCGGDLEIVAGSSVMECEYCGTQQTVPNADNEKKLTLFARANRLRMACEFDKATGIYESIVAEFPEEAEAYWGLVLCKYGIEYVDDPATGKKIPTCHRSSFDSVMDDANLEQALENADVVAQKVYREEAKQMERIRKGILEVSSAEQPYDIFICYKETDEKGGRTLDSVLAQDLYGALTDKGYRVFFSRITLQGKLGEAYEPYIFAALNSAKVMLAVGTCYEYYNAVWVKNEWSRYIKICEADKSKHLIPCYKDLDPEDMPKEFNHLQGADLGKMGAIQDILFNMEKYIPLKKQTVVQEHVAVGANNKVAALLERGDMALEDGDWAKADGFFEEVLNNDAKNAQAYIGKALAQEKCRNMDAFFRKRKEATLNAQSKNGTLSPDTAHVDAAVDKYALPGFVDANNIRKLYDCNLSYPSYVASRQQQYQDEEKYWANHKLFSRAEQFATGAVAEDLAQKKGEFFAALTERIKKAEESEELAKKKVREKYEQHLCEADAKAEALYEAGAKQREEQYQTLLQIAKTSSNVSELNRTAGRFQNLGDYKDSKMLSKHCRERADEEKKNLAAEAERQRVAQEKEAERQRIAQEKEAEHQRIIQEKESKARAEKAKRIGIVSAVAAAIIVVAVLVISKVIAPTTTLNKAISIMEAGDYAEAREILVSLNGFGSSSGKIAVIDALDDIDLGDFDTAIQEILGADEKISLTLALDGGTSDFGDAVELSSSGITTLSTPEKEGYSFAKWELEGYRYQKESSLMLNLKAVWTDEFSIHYDLAGGKANNPTTYHKDSGGPITLAHPTREGYTFLGWTGTELNGMVKNVTIPAGSYGNRAYTANWSPNQYTLTFDTNGGSVEQSSVSAAYDSAYSLPIPTKDYNIFGGWYDGEVEYANGRWPAAKDVTLIARWNPVVYKITYELDGGVNAAENAAEFTVESPTITLIAPSKEGYRFVGWYSDSNFENTVTEIPAGSHDNITLYAKWELATYTITYKLNGGTLPATAKNTFTMHDLPVTLPDASKSSMIFLGWLPDGTNGKPLEEISSCGDVTLSASFLDPNLSLALSSNKKYYIVTGYSGSAKHVDIPAYYKDIPVTQVGAASDSSASIRGIFSSSVTSVTLPNTITKISDGAFKSANITSIVIPDSVTHIGEWAFWYCQKLTTVTFSNSLKSIGYVAFGHCTSLTSVVLPDSLTSLGGSVFTGCSALKSVVLPQNLTTIDSQAFEECRNLTTITLPEKLRRIDEEAFIYCSSLKKLIIPASVTTIEDMAFWGCNKVSFYCRTESIPSGWDSDWNNGRPVTWGYTGN